MDLFSVVLMGSGGIFIYSAVKGFNPVDVVKYALGGSKPVSFADAGKGTPQSDPPLAPKYNLGPDGGLTPSDPGDGDLLPGQSPLNYPYPTTDPIPPGTNV